MELFKSCFNSEIVRSGGRWMEQKYTCCVTGHRDIPAEKLAWAQEQLRHELMLAVQVGYTHFISGFAAGADLIFTGAVAEMKGRFPITLEAAIPYPGRLKTPDNTFHALLKKCDTVRIHSSQYCRQCYMIRNRYMVDASSLVIAVYDGRGTGGTAATIRYTRQTGRDIREVRL